MQRMEQYQQTTKYVSYTHKSNFLLFFLSYFSFLSVFVTHRKGSKISNKLQEDLMNILIFFMYHFLLLQDRTLLLGCIEKFKFFKIFSILEPLYFCAWTYIRENQNLEMLLFHRRLLFRILLLVLFFFRHHILNSNRSRI